MIVVLLRACQSDLPVRMPEPVRIKMYREDRSAGEEPSAIACLWTVDKTGEKLWEERCHVTDSLKRCLGFDLPIEFLVDYPITTEPPIFAEMKAAAARAHA